MKKQLSIVGFVWDSVPLLHVFDKIYQSRFISFYDPWLKGELDTKKIILFKEKNKSILIWPFKIVIRTIKILDEIKKFNPDLVISQHDDANISLMPAMFFYRTIYKKKIKFVIFIHRGVVEYEEKSLIMWLSRIFLKLFYNKYDKIITVSEGNKQLLERKFGLKKVLVLYNPINLRKDILMSKIRLDKEDEKMFSNSFVFVSIGRLEPQKGQWHLIKAFSIVQKKHPYSKLIILGEGELRKKLEELITQLKLSDSVLLLGRKDNVFKYIKQSDCFVLTSLWESFGQVIVEAMALNKPIISTDCEFGPREIIAPNLPLNKKLRYPVFAEHGVLTKPFNNNEFKIDSKINIDHEKLAEVMSIFIENKSLRTKYSHGVVRAKDFDEKVIAEQLKRLDF